MNYLRDLFYSILGIEGLQIQLENQASQIKHLEDTVAVHREGWLNLNDKIMRLEAEISYVKGKLNGLNP